MAARGPYAKGKAKRAEILDAALAVIDEQGYSAATVKELADAVGLSQNGLLHYFGSKDALFAEILRRRDELSEIEIDVQREGFAENMVEALLSALDAETSSPGLAQLALRVTGEATEPDHLAHEFIRHRYELVRVVVRDAIVQLQSEERLAPDIDPDAVAALVYASWDGLRIQWMYDRSIDLRAHMAYLLRALGITVAARSIPA
ncbi:TetR/AcrR family transcriptional regulator [Leifsonia naganoensis]|uniref:AcrR family transcriptional regulator n=1 Tax=Leifsonia naganoensis TaxID=150025 RepID=A0A853DW01_9MICO|nr:TetR/AcrR family transcriptional regulator [Leifsonia naganoensis]NYK10105.1 AcrR family transcriptional regulator [Leifsonia naganoensis]